MEQYPVYRGKVRNVYDLGDQLLMVASDRFSAFDVVFQELIPGKGKILTEIAAHWFTILPIRSHFISVNPADFPEQFRNADFEGRSMLVQKAKRIDYECVVRGALMGSGYKEYTSSGTLAGSPLPMGIRQGELLSSPVFTPARKNDMGHDENISIVQMEKEAGRELTQKLASLSMELFQFAAERLATEGIIILDTKFEFGLIGEEIILIDEVLTPDSSRFAFKEDYQKAFNQGEQIPTLDKQVVRDYLESIVWDKNPPPPPLPKEIVDTLMARYETMKEKILCIT